MKNPFRIIERTNSRSIKQSTVATVLGALVLVSGLTASTANATDAKTLSGISCAPVHGRQAGDFRRVRWGLQNISAATRQVACPIVRDNRANTNGLRFVRIYLSGGAVGSTTRCTVFARAANGGAVDEAVGTITAPGNMIELSMDQSAVDGTYAVFCLLPAKRRLHTIHWDEW